MIMLLQLLKYIYSWTMYYELYYLCHIFATSSYFSFELLIT